MSSNQSLLDPVERHKTLISKYERGILEEKYSNLFSNFREILDKAAIKPHMTKKASRSFEIQRRG